MGLDVYGGCRSERIGGEGIGGEEEEKSIDLPITAVPLAPGNRRGGSPHSTPE